MYEPVLNSVLVMINDEDAKYGGGNDDSMLGKSYSKGTVVEVAAFVSTDDYPIPYESLPALQENIVKLKGRNIMWNEGSEAGTTFEFDSKLFGMIYWWDIRGVLVGGIEDQLDKADNA